MSINGIFAMSVFIRGLLLWSVGPFRSSVRVGSFGYHLLSRWSTTGPNFKSGGPANSEISRGGHMPPPVPTVEVSEVALRRVKEGINPTKKISMSHRMCVISKMKMSQF